MCKCLNCRLRNIFYRFVFRPLSRLAHLLDHAPAQAPVEVEDRFAVNLPRIGDTITIKRPARYGVDATHVDATHGLESIKP